MLVFLQKDMDTIRYAPKLQKMTQYIENHYGDEILREVEENFRAAEPADLLIDPDLDLDMKEGEHAEIYFDHSEGKLRHMQCWQLSRTLMAVDMQARLKIGVSLRGELPRFFQRTVYITSEFDLSDGIARREGLRYISMQAPEAREDIRLSDHLVPILRYDEMDHLFRRMLIRYLGENALEILRRSGPRKLAEAMGLSIRSLPLYHAKGTRAMLFAHEATVLVNTDGAEDYHELRVPARTIVLNMNAARQDETSGHLALYHECAHWEFHSMFLMLQQLHRADLLLLEYAEADKASRAAEKDVKWVEKQADFFAYAAILPRDHLVPLMRKYWSETSADENMGDRVEKVIRCIGQELQRPYSLIRTRMIMLGSVAAKGACNYVDGEYIRPFAFCPDHIRGGETFVINRANFVQLYKEDHDFRQLMLSQDFIYAEGHVCQNHPFVVEAGEDGAVLTEWARAHVDECCLKFCRDYILTPKSPMLGVLRSVQGFNGHYVPIIAEGQGKMTQHQLMKRDVTFLSELPRTPAEALSTIIEKTCKTQREAAFLCGLSETMVSNMCGNNNFRYTIKQVTRLVVGLGMPPALSLMFLEMAGFNQAKMLSHYDYQCVILYMWMDGIEKVEESCPKLF